MVKGLSRYGDYPGLPGWAQSNHMKPVHRNLPFPVVVRDVMMKGASEKSDHLRGTQPNWPWLALKMEDGPHAKEHSWFLEARKGQEMVSASEITERKAALLTL